MADWTGTTLPLLARTDDYVVVAKPSGLTVHRSKLSRGERRFALQVLRDQLGQHVHPVHRLDRPTSGCLIFALNSRWSRILQEALVHEESEKVYVAMVRGAADPDAAPVVVDNPMTDPNGVEKTAVTRLRVLGSSKHPRCSLVEARPRTGRFHQVRRHVRDLSHPVLGDSKHGDTRVNRAWREEWGVDRLQLHCLRVDLALPDGERLRVTCPLPDDLSGLWRRMPWWPEAVERLPELAC